MRHTIIYTKSPQRDMPCTYYINHRCVWLKGAIGDGTGQSQIQRCLDWSMTGWDDPSKSSRQGCPFSTSYRRERAPPLHRHQGAWALPCHWGWAGMHGQGPLRSGCQDTRRRLYLLLGVEPISTRDIHNLWIFRRSSGVCFSVLFFGLRLKFHNFG
jgi:hypothetical protein